MGLDFNKLQLAIAKYTCIFIKNCSYLGAQASTSLFFKEIFGKISRVNITEKARIQDVLMLSLILPYLVQHHGHRLILPK
jgi:hypothetical protein